MFELHPTLANDTSLVIELPLSQVLLMNNVRYPWIILVPQRENILEIHHLEPDDQTTLFQELIQASNIMESIFSPDKINVGALGNMVPQLHVHVIARFKDDVAWPDPVWGHGDTIPYGPRKRERLQTQLADAFKT
ncbi:MAG: HIT domain-containing protein [Rhodospirillales bacterium]|jgi:diadenosine tetraphosphate (Ap4A) HIT family hydrolase